MSDDPTFRELLDALTYIDDTGIYIGGARIPGLIGEDVQITTLDPGDKDREPLYLLEVPILTARWPAIGQGAHIDPNGRIRAGRQTTPRRYQR